MSLSLKSDYLELLVIVFVLFFLDYILLFDYI